MGIFAFSPAHRGQSEPFIIELEKGAKPRKVAALLESNHIVSSADQFWFVGKILGHWGRIKAGEYEINAGMSPIQILRVFTSGISRAISITIKEGDNMYQVADQLTEKGFSDRKTWLSLFRNREFIRSLEIASAPATLEGYLFPDTYGFQKKMPPQDITRAMVRKFNSVWDDKISARARELKMTQHDVVILASMVEKETGAPSERPMIASVFFNRLRKRMRLQSDPTTIYGMWETYTGNILRSDLRRPTPFNTYTVAALPAGPIANPGKESLNAVLWPEQSEFLYFVSRNDGTHEFTKSLQDHERAVAQFQLDRSARTGKSWRDLKNRTKAE